MASRSEKGVNFVSKTDWKDEEGEHEGIQKLSEDYETLRARSLGGPQRSAGVLFSVLEIAYF